MTIEAGVLLDEDENILCWHLPPGRNAGYLPDSRALWDVMWENKDKNFVFVHSHPGSGSPRPSYEDVTTFSAVELGLGKRYTWYIISEDHIAAFVHSGPGALTYRVRWEYRYGDGPLGNWEWMRELRKHSNYAPLPEGSGVTTQENKESM